MVKIAFIGVGYMGQNAHLKNYIGIPDCEVVGIVDARIGLAKKVATAYGVKSVFSSIEELMENVEVDGFVASQRYINHINIVPELAKHGKPIFTEKPIALSVENGQAILDTTSNSGAVHMIGYHKRSDPAMEYAIKKIEDFKESGKLGKLKYLRALMPAGDWISGAPDALSTDEPYPNIEMEKAVNYYEDPELNREYDVFVNYYIHQINAIRFLLGEDYEITFAEKTKTVLFAQSNSGIPCTLEMSPFYTSLDWFESYLVCFEKGYVLIELPAPLVSQRAGKVTVFEDVDSSPIKYTPTLPNVHAMKKQAINFVDVVKGLRKPPACGEDAVKDLACAKKYISLLE